MLYVVTDADAAARRFGTPDARAYFVFISLLSVAHVMLRLDLFDGCHAYFFVFLRQRLARAAAMLLVFAMLLLPAADVAADIIAAFADAAMMPFCHALLMLRLLPRDDYADAVFIALILPAAMLFIFSAALFAPLAACRFRMIFIFFLTSSGISPFRCRFALLMPLFCALSLYFAFLRFCLLSCC